MEFLMFDNLLYQDVGKLLIQDLVSKKLPQSILLSGPPASGKLTCALELARIVSCHTSGEEKGKWSCTCESCLKYKALVHPDLLLTGFRDCTLEIAAAAKTLLQASESKQHLEAARYLYIRSVRKLTARFNPVLIEGDTKASKIEPLIVSLDEMLEEIEPHQELPSVDKLQKIIDKIAVKAQQLESGFMYESLPVSQIRKASMWARYTVADSKKVLIIENADRMQEGVRNALLKILEEPPADTLFILTTSRRSAVMPTILSRVRTYTFNDRTFDQQCEVIGRIFHSNVPVQKDTKEQNMVIEQYLNSFLPITPEHIAELASDFISTIHKRHVPNIDDLAKEMKNFEPRVMLKMFFNELIVSHEHTLYSITDASEYAAWQEIGAKLIKTIQESYSNIITFNQTPASAFDQIVYIFLEEGLL
jgi:DNA polymerase-3 subunit gamma/tau